MRKSIVLAAVGLLLVPVLLLAVAAAFLPSERVAALAASRAEAALGREVAIGDVGLSLFPLAASLERVALAGPTAADSPVATVERLLLRPRLLPLLRGQVVVDELRLDRPRVHVAVDSAGASNLPVLERDASSSEPGGSIVFDVQEVRLVGADLRLDDARTGRAVRVDGLDQTLRLAGGVSGGRLAGVLLRGGLTIDSLAVRLPGDDGWTVRGLRLAVDHNATLHADSGRVRVDSLRLALNDVVLRGAGTATGLLAATGDSAAVPMLDLRLDAEPFDIARLIASLPARYTAPLREGEATLGGTAALSATVRGPFGVDAFPAVAGRLVLSDVSASRAGSELLDGLTGTVDFTRDSASTSSLTGSLLGEPMRLSFRAHDAVDPVIGFAFDGTVDLERARLAGLLPDSLPPLGGRVAPRVRGTIRRSTPAASRIEGTVALEGFTAENTNGRRVEVPAASLVLDGDSAVLPATRLLLARQPVTLAAAVRGWLPVALGDSSGLPRARVDARARRLDLAPLLGPAPEPTFSQLVFARLAGATVQGRSAASIAEERGAAPPSLPRALIRATVRVDTLLNAGVAYTDVDATVDSRPDRLLVERATFGMMGGRGDVAAVLTPTGGAASTGGAAPTGMHVLVTATMEDLASDAFLPRFTSFRDRLGGRLDLNGAVEMMLDGRMLPDPQTLKGRGVTQLRDGRLVNLPVLRTLGRQLGVAAFDTLQLREFAGGFDVTGSMVRFDDAMIETASGSGRVAGSFSFDGKVDLGAEAGLPARLAARGGPALAGAAAAVADTDGTVPVALRIGGSWQRPDVALDLSAARANVVNAAREAGRREAERLADQGARALADRLGIGARDSTSGDTAAATAPALPSVDSLGSAVDSARRTLENRARDRLRSLF